jgi:raffinose/stachyose/melibiose transport system permease protein
LATQIQGSEGVTRPPASADILGPGEPRPVLRRRPGRIKGHDGLAITLFLAPPLLLFVLLVLTPIVVAAFTSLYKWNGFGFPSNNIGFGNFTRAFGNETFIKDLWHGLGIILLSLVVQLPAALGLAMLLNQRLRFRAVYRVLFFAPYVLSEVTTAVLFKIVFSPNRGLVNYVFERVGFSDLGALWLADPKYVFYSLFLVISWKYFGFHMILYLAGRQGIPNELHEAAITDGASAWQTFWHVTLPLLGPTIRISIFLSVIGALQLFDMVWVLTEGGPIHATETLAVTMYQFGFKRFEVGYASAISIVMFLISLVFALLYQRFVLRRDLEGALTAAGDRR